MQTRREWNIGLETLNTIKSDKVEPGQLRRMHYSNGVTKYVIVICEATEETYKGKPYEGWYILCTDAHLACPMKSTMEMYSSIVL